MPWIDVSRYVADEPNPRGSGLDRLFAATVTALIRDGRMKITLKLPDGPDDDCQLSSP